MVISAIQQGLLEEFPKQFDQIHIGRINEEEDQFDFGVFKIGLDPLRAVITGIVANNDNPPDVRVLRLNLLKQQPRMKRSRQYDAIQGNLKNRKADLPLGNPPLVPSGIIDANGVNPCWDFQGDKAVC